MGFSLLKNLMVLFLDQRVAVGRVLSPSERINYEVACAVKRLIISKMNARHKTDPNCPVEFVLVDKRTLRLRVSKKVNSLNLSFLIIDTELLF